MAPMGKNEAMIVPITIFNWITPEPIIAGKKSLKKFFTFWFILGIFNKGL